MHVLRCATFLLRCGTMIVSAAGITRHNVAQCDGREAYPDFDLRCHLSVVSQWHYNMAPGRNLLFFLERGDQKRGTTAWQKRDTMTGTLESNQ